MSSDARKRAEEALRSCIRAMNEWAAQEDGLPDTAADAVEEALSAISLLASEPAPPAGAEVARLTALLRECNAVCLCGCPESEHESYGEDGESCGHDDHECIRVAPAVLEIVQRYRVALSDALAQKPDGAEVSEAVEMLRLTLGMRDVKHACDDRACSNVALAALNLLAALRGGQKGGA